MKKWFFGMLCLCSICILFNLCVNFKNIDFRKYDHLDLNEDVFDVVDSYSGGNIVFSGMLDKEGNEIAELKDGEHVTLVFKIVTDENEKTFYKTVIYH